MSEEHYGRSAEARARRRRSIITMIIVLLGLFFAAWYALSYIRAEDHAGAEESTTSESATCDLSPGQVDVNVYNATSREGLAAQVARDLKKRGFTVKTVANDPKKVEVTGRGELRHGPDGAKGAELVSRHAGTFSERTDERERTDVDVVLGPDYRHLVDEDRATAC